MSANSFENDRSWTCEGKNFKKRLTSSFPVVTFQPYRYFHSQSDQSISCLSQEEENYIGHGVLNCSFTSDQHRVRNEFASKLPEALAAARIDSSSTRRVWILKWSRVVKRFGVCRVRESGVRGRERLDLPLEAPFWHSLSNSELPVHLQHRRRVPMGENGGASALFFWTREQSRAIWRRRAGRMRRCSVAGVET